MMLRQQMESARLLKMSIKTFFLSQLRLAPRDWAMGSTMFEGVGLQKITSIKLQLPHNKDTITYTKNKKCYKDMRYKCIIITSVLNVSKRYQTI
jgi:hypothetical protein